MLFHLGKLLIYIFDAFSRFKFSRAQPKAIIKVFNCFRLLDFFSRFWRKKTGNWKKTPFDQRFFIRIGFKKSKKNWSRCAKGYIMLKSSVKSYESVTNYFHRPIRDLTKRHIREIGLNYFRYQIFMKYFWRKTRGIIMVPRYNNLSVVY